MRALLCLSLLLPLVGGCWVNDNLPSGGTSTCNNNRRCELSLREDCTSCPGDCPCCRAVEAAGYKVQEPEKATLKADSSFAQLGPGSTLTLTVGREIYDGDGPDFLLVGEVTSASSVALSSGCPLASVSGDAFRVEVSVTSAGPYELVGFWAKERAGSTGTSAVFDLACAGSSSLNVRHVRLVSLGNATAKLDALSASSCVE